MPKSKLAKINIDIELEVISKKWLQSQNIEKFIKSQTKELFRYLPLKNSLKSNIKLGLGISLRSNYQIKKINQQFRKINKPTDVLSFGNLDEKIIQQYGLKQAIGDNKYFFLGDLVLSYEYIEKEALKQQKNFNDHLTHLILHGLLHLIGYDHTDNILAKIMETQEIKILKKLNIKNPYRILKVKKSK